MQYKMKYLVWKTERAWFLFDSVALNFGVGMMTFIIYTALYY
jgi:hypothetical protein